MNPTKLIPLPSLSNTEPSTTSTHSCQHDLSLTLGQSRSPIQYRSPKQKVNGLIFLYSIFKLQFEMKNSTMMNIMNEFLVYKNQSLGKGATGEVYQGKSLKDRTEVAVKVIELKTIDNEVTEYLLEMEKIALMTVVNPHVLRGLKVIQNKEHCFLITELCNGGTLKSLIKATGPLGEERSLKLLTEVLRGECSLIGKGIIHRDLKPANILLHNGEAKIIDFGYCEIRGHKKPSLEYNVGSPSYMAPEAFLYNEYSEKSEVWALGVTFYECLNGKTFDDGKEMGEVFKEIKRNGLPYRTQVSEKCKHLIRWCLEQDPRKRPTCVELLNHLLSEDTPSRVATSHSVRVSFAPLDNDPRTAKIEKRDSLKARLDLPPTLALDQLRKGDIMRSNDNKIRHAISNYEPKKYIFEKKPVEVKPTVYYTTKIKSEKNSFLAEARPPIRQKSQLFEPENNPSVYFSSRQKSKQHIFGYNPARTKMLSRPSGAHQRFGSINMDYFGHMTDRF